MRMGSERQPPSPLAPSSHLWNTRPRIAARLTPGPIPLVFAMLVVYYAIVPPSKPRYFGALGLDFSDKAFTFAVAGMVRSSIEFF